MTLFLHTWNNDFKIKMSYKTGINTSYYSKYEQRTCRILEPRLTITKEIFLYKKDFSYYSKNQVERFTIPVDIEYIDDPSIAGAVVSVDTTNFFYLRNFSNIKLVDDDENTYTVSSYTNSSITTSAPISACDRLYIAVSCFITEIDVTVEREDYVLATIVAEKIRE